MQPRNCFRWYISTKLWNANACYISIPVYQLFPPQYLKFPFASGIRTAPFKLFWSRPRFQNTFSQNNLAHNLVLGGGGRESWNSTYFSSFIFFNSFTEIYFICHKIQHLKHTVQWFFTILIKLGNHHHNLILEQLYPIKKPHTCDALIYVLFYSINLICCDSLFTKLISWPYNMWHPTVGKKKKCWAQPCNYMFAILVKG